jgi:hypothetical protein
MRVGLTGWHFINGLFVNALFCVDLRPFWFQAP